MKATLFTCALAALASSALARPQQGYNSPPTYGSQSGSGTGSNKPNGAGSGTGPQPSSISSPIGGSQNGNKPQGSGNNGNGPSSIIPGQSVSSPVAGTQPQGSQPQGVNGGSGNGGVVPGQSVSSPVAGSQQTPQSGAGPLAPGSTLGGLLPGSNGGVQLSGQNGNGQQGGVSGAVPGQNGGISGAVPGQNGGVGSGISGGQCVSHQEAYQFIQLFQSILAKQNSPLGTPEQTANYLLADNFTETSNSILSLEGLSLNGDGLSAHSKQEWIEGVVNHAPPYGEIQDIKILVDCNEVLWYYNFGKIGSGQYPIKGYDLFTLTRTGSYQGQSSQSGQSGQQGSPLQVEALYVEFDSIAWGLDTNEVVCSRPDESGSAAGGQQSASASSSGSQS